MTGSVTTRYSIILGCPRSGTTFLLRALEPLPRTEVLSGLVFPPQLPHLAEAMADDETVTGLIELSFLWSLDFFAEYAERAKSWVVGEWTRRNVTTAELIASLRGRRRIESVIYKEPFLAFAPQLAYRAVPGAKIVHIHRDGRDCADSLERKYHTLTDEKLSSLRSNEAPLGRKVDHRYVPWWVAPGEEDGFLAATPYIRSVWMWREILRRCNDFFSLPDVQASGRVMSIRYEALMADPLGVGERVIAHVGGTMTKSVRTRLLTGHTRSIGAYRRRDPAEIAAATELAAPELDRLGYRR